MHPVDELLAEHWLMRAALAGMRQEALDLRRNRPLRPQLWSKVVDVIGNFIHRIHRVKEEAVFFPRLLQDGIIDASDRAHLLDENEQLQSLALALCDGANEGAWEKAMRIAARYLSLMESHLRSGEQRLVNPLVRALPPETERQLREAFTEIETARLGEADRGHYLELVRTICRETGVSFEQVLQQPD
jgi:hemerythrin-like domain-containing protein